MSTRDWLLLNEIGWGVPQGWVAAAAAVAVMLRSLGWQVARFASWLASRHSTR